MQLKDFFPTDFTFPDGDKQRQQQRAEIVRRMKRAGVYREIFTGDSFYACQTARPKKRARNTFSREEAGTCGQVIRTKNFKYVHVAYKTYNNN